MGTVAAAQNFVELLVEKVALEGSVVFVEIDIVAVGAETERFTGLFREGKSQP